MKNEHEVLGRLGGKTIVRVFNTFGINIRRRSPKPIEELLAPLDVRFRSPLLSMYRGEPQLGADGQMHAIDRNTKISPSQGMWLYNLCLAAKPKSAIEIGMAYGYSTLYFLAAIAKNQVGHHTAVDPFQKAPRWAGIGLAHAQSLAPRNGLESAFLLIEDRSDHVATDLARSNSKFEIIFIDGNHRLDDVLVDFYLYAPLCALGGHIIFDDVRMPSIQTVVAFVRANRTDFIEVPTIERNICAFKKVGEDFRNWNDFHEFAVARGT